MYTIGRHSSSLTSTMVLPSPVGLVSRIPWGLKPGQENMKVLKFSRPKKWSNFQFYECKAYFKVTGILASSIVYSWFYFPSFTPTVPSVVVKMKRFQELLTQLLQQHSALSHVLPALKDVVSNAINFTSIMSLHEWVYECECISAQRLIPPPSLREVS